MDSLTYTVITEIGDVESQHADSITAQCKKILSTLHIGDTIVAKDFIKKVMPNFSKTSRIKHLTNMGYRHLRAGKNIGMLREHEIARKSIEYNDLIHLDSIQYWTRQLSETKYKNVRPNRELVGTRDNYTHLLWQFNEWLQEKTFSCFSSRKVDDDLYECKYQDVSFGTVEDMLNLCKKENSRKEDFNGTHYISNHTCEWIEGYPPELFVHPTDELVLCGNDPSVINDDCRFAEENSHSSRPFGAGIVGGMIGVVALVIGAAGIVIVTRKKGNRK
jgi:hypothetical protein